MLQLPRHHFFCRSPTFQRQLCNPRFILTIYIYIYTYTTLNRWQIKLAFPQFIRAKLAVRQCKQSGLHTAASAWFSYHLAKITCLRILRDFFERKATCCFHRKSSSEYVKNSCWMAGSPTCIWQLVKLMQPNFW